MDDTRALDDEHRYRGGWENTDNGDEQNLSRQATTCFFSLLLPCGRHASNRLPAIVFDNSSVVRPLGIKLAPIKKEAELT